MKNKIEILCTLGPASLNKNFLKFVDKKVDLLRINLSHIEIKDLKKIINNIKNLTNTLLFVLIQKTQIRTKINIKDFKKSNI